MSFIPWTDHVIKWEGGLVDDPADSGGLTNMGVTWTRFELQAPQVLGIAATLDNFHNLTKDQVRKFMFEVWKTSKAFVIGNKKIGAMVAEIAWMSGEKIAGTSLQNVLNDRGGDLVPDGKIGPLTLAELDSQNKESVYKALISYRKNWLIGLANRRPKDLRFLNGWINRLSDFQARFPAFSTPSKTSTKSGFILLALIALVLK